MYNEAEQRNWRFWFVVTALSVAAIGVTTRLVFLHASLATIRARQPRYQYNHTRKSLRGHIYPAKGRESPLAMSTPIWEYHADPVAVDQAERNRDEIARIVSEALKLPYEKVQTAYAKEKARYVPLTNSSDDEAYEKLCNARKVPGVVIEEKHRRVYPQGRTASHIVGFVNRDPTNTVGCAGIEQRYNEMLRGIPGKEVGLQDARRHAMGRSQIDVPEKDGADIYLTIDHNLQYETERALRGGFTNHVTTAAWAIVLQVKTGAILAMASLPDYSPEDFTIATPESRKNRAISENFEPGSVMKVITAASALNEGILTPQRAISTEGGNCWYYCGKPLRESHTMPPMMTIKEALAQSSNIFFGKVGVEMGPLRMWKYMRAFGLGEKTGVELPGEEFGILPDWKKWDKLKYSRAPIGQGVCVTPLQLAAAYAAIGNDGVAMQPYLVEKIISSDGEELYAGGPKVRATIIRPSVAKQVREMMTAVTAKHGTARRAAVPGYSIAGKTGTAQRPGPNGRGYSQTEFTGSFCGIIPASRPELVILVSYQRRKYTKEELSQDPKPDYAAHQGGHTAAVAFRKIAEAAVRYYGIEPDLPDELE